MNKQEFMNKVAEVTPKEKKIAVVSKEAEKEVALA